MEEFFHFWRTKICAGIRAMVDASLYSLVQCRISAIRQQFHYQRMLHYAETISEKCGLWTTIWGCIGGAGGTLRQTCRPTYYHQRLRHSGHKCTHCMKCQAEVTPDGINPFDDMQHVRIDPWGLKTLNYLSMMTSGRSLCRHSEPGVSMLSRYCHKYASGQFRGSRTQ